MSGIKLPKVRQVIWLPYQLFNAIGEICLQTQQAPNTVITQCLQKYLLEKGEPILVKTQTVEKEVQKLVCPMCLRTFMDLNEITNHLNEKGKCFQKFMELMSARVVRSEANA
ncbi:hypothetical protein G4O51_12480 [Candidatus Bathyarchaeota archaeon A05DMB-2]|jgi:hypothetical protein|nr:hypothetical protein [Candidatus Bathyarchaeota archaeon A05DMB-2]